MTFEELKKEAAAQGFRLVKDSRPQKMMPCICGCTRRERRVDCGWTRIRCPICGREAYGHGETDARRAWNIMILGEMHGKS